MESCERTSYGDISTQGSWAGNSRVPLAEIFEGVVAGVSVNGEDRPALPSEFGVLKVSCVKDGVFFPSENKAILPHELVRAQGKFAVGDILVSRANTPELVGSCGYIERDYPNLFLCDKTWRFRVKNPHRDNARFFAYLLASKEIRQEISNRATGTSKSMKNISKDAFLGIRVPRPSIQEQNEISEILFTWERAVVCSRQIIANLRILQREFHRVLFGKRMESVPFETAGSIFELFSRRGNSELPLLSATQDQGVVPRHLMNGRVMSPQGDTSSYKLVEEGDFVISLRSFQGGIEYSRYRGVVSPAYTVLRAKRQVVKDFYRHFFKSYIFIERYLRIAIIGIRDGKQISVPDFMGIELPYPSESAQRLVAEILNTLELRLLKEIELSENLLKQQQALLHDLLTGKIRVKVR